MPLFPLPESNWVAPTNFPEIRDARIIGLDTETRDPDLQTKGPSTKRGGGYIIGVSVATDDGFKGYYPVRHEGGGNLDAPNVFAWLRDQLSGSNPKVGANLIYDLEWLQTENVQVAGPVYDVQIAEPLLDENKRSYKLDILAEQYCGVHKTEDHLKEVAKAMGISENKIKENLWKFRACDVGMYAEDDALLALQIFNLQIPKLKAEGLWEVFELESRMTRVLLAMRGVGIPINESRGQQILEQLKKEQKVEFERVSKMAGRDVDIWSGTDIAKACDRLGLIYPRTKVKINAKGKESGGNPSFEAEWLSDQPEEFYKHLLLARQLDRGGAVFIQKKILEMAANGRVYATFRQVRSDDGGTKSGRFASANPNMEQVPARNEYLAPLIRSIFVSEPGTQFGVFDYSQQEPRVTVHYAFRRGFRGAAEARQRYLDDPSTDYHQLVADMVGIKRKDAKELNLGLAYGMGKDKMALKLGRSKTETVELYNKYHAGVPFVKLLGDECMRVANDRGFVKTILGRKRRFDLFGPRQWKDGLVPLPREQALEEFGPPVTRYFVHKAMNAVVQGTAADMIKKAMLDLHDAGFVLYNTIHDEVDMPIETLNDARIARDIMIDAVKLEVPMKLDVELGPSWGEAKEVEL
jgi:DNA polymerase I-like protein with 3'-5' exonuclease and polymerase domains